MREALCIGLAALLCAPPAGAQQGPPRTLTVEWIMQGPALYGYEPRAVRWSGDGRRVYFEWKQASEPPEKEYSTWVVNRDGSGLRRLSDEEALEAPPARASKSADGRVGVFAREGDIWLYDYGSDRARRITRTGEAESSPRLTRDGRRVTFVRGGNLFVLSLESGEIEQLTHIVPPGQPDGDEQRKGTASQEYLKKEERALLEAVDKRARQREEREEKRKKENPRRPLRLTQRQTVTDLYLSPDEKYVLAVVTERPQEAKTALMPLYVTETAYTETQPTRTKVGDVQPRQRMALIRADNGEVRWLEAGLKATRDGKEVERPVTLANPQWSEDGARLAVLGRAADFKDRWVFAVDVEAARLRPLFHLHDDAWVGGPGAQALGWLPGGREVWFQAERDGWSHLYAANWETGEVRALTGGRWEVKQAELSPNRESFLLTTSEESPYEQHLYLMPAHGGARTKLTSAPGFHDGELSPDGAMLAVIHSRTNQPPELFLMAAKPGAEMRRVTVSPSAEFSRYPWIEKPIVEIPARDGARIPAHIYKPANWKKGGPAVIFVHGAGYLQNVHRGWSSYAREMMFHHLLMERGYLVLDLDYRGSAGHGRDWRTAVYRHMGGKDLDDQVDAAKWLAAEHGVDPRRIGIYGGSYGGFLTLMAMFTQPGVFAAGAALRPVTDWAHYNHPYTGAILNLPQDDPEAYRRSSPIYHAAGLRGALLICHGMADANVHFQDTVRLAQKLIELGKENWEVAIYPVEDHGFVNASSWTDEYRRILKLFETNLRK
ncbi:MAG: prolyl oligopeptidase family serine peptidase [Bryobacteraceae bacterium]|nr:prolyl oligopeptidase family serine peptidase [Bryobacteraceae bacterium]